MGGKEFLKSVDRYGQVVSLTYKKSGKYDTTAGGAATVIVFFVLSYWIALQLFFSIYDNGSFNTSLSRSVTQLSDGNFPVFEFES